MVDNFADQVLHLFFQHLAGTVLGAVVNYDDLLVLNRSLQDLVYQGKDVFLLVIARKSLWIEFFCL